MKAALEGVAAELRKSFDESFARPHQHTAPDVEDFLAIRVAGDAYALRLREISGIIAGPKVTPVPASAPGFLGLAGIRGGVVPVFGLAPLLGYEQASAESRWMGLCGTEDLIALAFPDLEGFLRLPKSSVLPDETIRAGRRYVNEVARTDAGPRAIVAVPLVVAAIFSRRGA